MGRRGGEDSYHNDVTSVQTSNPINSNPTRLVCASTPRAPFNPVRRVFHWTNDRPIVCTKFRSVIAGKGEDDVRHMFGGLEPRDCGVPAEQLEDRIGDTLLYLLCTVIRFVRDDRGN